MSGDRPVRVFDTSAILALRGDEEGAERVQRLLDEADEGLATVLLSFMTRMELLYVVRREEGEEAALAALRLVDAFPVDWVTCDADILDRSARIKSEGKLSVADAWIAATAVERDATLVHCDPEFTGVPRLKQEWLGPTPPRPPSPPERSPGASP